MNVDELVDKFYLNEGITSREIAKDEGIAVRKMNDLLVSGGISRSEIRQRSLDDRFKHIVKSLGLEDEKDIHRCEICRMFLIEDKKKMPEDWHWSINGRYGDICNSCLKESGFDSQWRFSHLHKIGCIICWKEYSTYSFPEIHHTRYGRGIGQAKKHEMTIPLCSGHHRLGGIRIAFHAGRDVWECEHGTEQKLLKETNLILMQYGD